MSQKKRSIAKVLAYIEENLDEDLRLDTIADRAGYSKFHLNRMFTEEVGCTMHKYIQQRRLTRAADKLVNTDRPIADIAYEARYESQQAFTLAFRQVYLYPPQVYRNRGVYAPARRRTVVMAFSGLYRKWGMAA